MKRTFATTVLVCGPWSVVRGLFCLVFAIAGCNFAPKYQRPAVQTPAAFKELSPQSADATNIWKIALPNDAAIHGKWWEMFGNAELSALEEQVAISNQNVAASFANFLVARAMVKEARAQLFPTLATGSAGVGVVRSRRPASIQPGVSNPKPSSIDTYSIPFEATWQPDIWGKVRDTIAANAFEAIASASDLQNTRLTAQAELATDFFQLRAEDSLIQLYADTVGAYRESLRLTRVRFNTGIASDEDVAQAETQLATAEAQATNLGILRSQLEHAIAVLIGKPPALFSIPAEPLKTMPPPTPFGVPSQLLERRPDVAAAERRVAEANQRIGIAKSAYFPNITLNAQGGLESATFSKLFDFSSRFWSIGANLAETIFDAGLRKATVQQFRAAYENTVATYRQTVLTAFQQVEDNLSSLRILTRQIQQQEVAVQSSERYLNLATSRYMLGIDSYLNVITAQTTYLVNRQTLVNLRSQQMASSVQLIQNVGGGWNSSQLPSQKQLLSRSSSLPGS